MNIIPTIIFDDFLPNPSSIREWALSLEYEPEEESRWPGVRSKPLQELNKVFYDYVTNKVLSLLYETKPYGFDCGVEFQLLHQFSGKGWIHQDSNLFTFILFLTPDDEVDCGTSIYELDPNKPFSPDTVFVSNNERLTQIRQKHHKGNELTKEEEEYRYNSYDKNFKQILNIKDKFNRIIIFPASNFHAANYFINNTNGNAGERGVELQGNFISYSGGSISYLENETK
jgi:hypothetical protein